MFEQRLGQMYYYDKLDDDSMATWVGLCLHLRVPITRTVMLCTPLGLTLVGAHYSEATQAPCNVHGNTCTSTIREVCVATGTGWRS